jgi:hypothetical protein
MMLDKAPTQSFTGPPWRSGAEGFRAAGLRYHQERIRGCHRLGCHVVCRRKACAVRRACMFWHPTR